MRVILISFVALAAAGCPARIDVPCNSNNNCDLATGGMCQTGPSANSWCSYPDSSCATGYRFSETGVGDGVAGQCVGDSLTDAGVDTQPSDADPPDMGVDAPPIQVRFDIAYVNEWRLGTAAASMNQVAWARIINPSPDPIDLSSATFTSVSDNHNQIVVAMSVENNAVQLNPGFSLGYLAGQAGSLIVGAGMVPEPDQSGGGGDGLIRITVTDLPPAGTWLVVTAAGTLRIGNAFVNISIDVVSSGTGSAATAFEATRASSTPL